jgi:hypothetical protein
MCDEKKNPMVATPQASAGLVADLLRTAERDLAAFYTAVANNQGHQHTHSNGE